LEKAPVLKTIVLILTMIPSIFLNAQQKVKSNAYNLTLKTLLRHDVPEVSAKQLAEMKNVVVLDARAKKEFEVSHIKNATWVGYEDFDLERLGRIPRNSRIVVYCSVGYRSEKVTEKLLKAGYSDVSNLYGGIFEWVNEGLPLCNESGPTENIHAFDRTWGVWLRKGKKVY
jgi:rhodanese-related sulfurtransferase